ncbi:MAG: heavy metal translocating P-type ATPase [Anaeroplasmataceae bacterium]
MSRKLKKNMIRIIISFVLFIIVFSIDKALDLASLIDNKYSYLLPFGLYLTIYLIIGYDVLRKALLNILHGQMLDENFLMVIATIGAFSLALYRGVKGLQIEGFDEGCAVLLFYQLGEWFQSYAVGVSRKNISSLLDIRPDYANIKKDDEILIVDPTSVKCDDIIIVYPGEKIPLDGVVIEGQTELDTKALTGESKPSSVAVGDEVISGCINLTESIIIRVTKEFYDSTVSKILDLVENASNQKSKSENFITKFAKVYTPIVVLLAFMLFLIPSLITSEWAKWSYRALSFLVVSCPCALVISVPLSFFSGIGACSREGILIKGSNYLEKLNKANIFIFDKTGTLTKGNFKIDKIEPIDKKDEILKYASIAEKGSSHPIAIAIREMANFYEEDGYRLENKAGSGIKATGKNVILCGNERLMIEENISYKPVSDIGSVIYVAVNNVYLGSILVVDEIKSEAYTLIDSLNNMNVKSIMLTGDNEEVAKNVVDSLKLTEFKAKLLPQNKVYEVEKIIENKEKNDVVCFVGDGINDAPVLMRSDIGISMGEIGSDAAIEASDIVLMYDDLSGIIKAKQIAKKTMRIVFENIVFAIGVKVIILILSAIGITNMYFAVFGDVGVSLIAILNAMRVNSKKGGLKK